MELAALEFQAIDPPPARFSRLEMNRCCWWQDQAGNLWVALEQDRPPWLGSPWNMRFQLALALGPPPAGRSRDYLLSRQELRGLARFGPAQARYSSLAGIAAVYRQPQDRLRGSLRLRVVREIQQPLGNWGRSTPYLMMGTFEAVHDQLAGQRIARQIGFLDEKEGAPPAPEQPPGAATSQPAGQAGP